MRNTLKIRTRILAGLLAAATTASAFSAASSTVFAAEEFCAEEAVICAEEPVFEDTAAVDGTCDQAPVLRPCIKPGIYNSFRNVIHNQIIGSVPGSLPPERLGLVYERLAAGVIAITRHRKRKEPVSRFFS